MENILHAVYMSIGIQAGLNDAETDNSWPQDLQSPTPQAIPSTPTHPHTKEETEHKADNST